MSDPVGPSGGQGLLEGLAGGFESGYGFREVVKGRRRAQQLQADLLTLRQQEGAREQTVFDEQQAAYKKAEALRAEVAAHLASPSRRPTFGQYISGQPGAHTGPPLSVDATTAQAVGRTLGEFGGHELTPDQALLVGSGEVPYGAIAPKAYHPRTRAEWLDNLRIAAGLRGQGTKLPITMDHAFTVLDRIYTTQDPKTGAWKSRLSPGQRLTIAKKMVAGTVQGSDFPDIQEEPAAGAPPPSASGPGLLDRIGNWFRGVPKANATPDRTPAAVAPGRTAAPELPLGGRSMGLGGGRDTAGASSRLEHARQTIAQYRDLSDDDLHDTLAEQGYSEEEIQTILGSAP